MFFLLFLLDFPLVLSYRTYTSLEQSTSAFKWDQLKCLNLLKREFPRAMRVRLSISLMAGFFFFYCFIFLVRLLFVLGTPIQSLWRIPTLDGKNNCFCWMRINISDDLLQQKCVKARALYDNIAEAPDELAFRKGDVLTVLEQNTAGLEGWWLCALRGRQVNTILLDTWFYSSRK